MTRTSRYEGVEVNRKGLEKPSELEGKSLWTSTSFSSRNTLLTFARTCFCCETEKFTRPQQNVTHRKANEDECTSTQTPHSIIGSNKKGEKLSETCEHFWILNIRITLFVLCPQILLLSRGKVPENSSNDALTCTNTVACYVHFSAEIFISTFSWHHGKLLALANRRELVENSHLQGLEKFDWEKSKIFSHFLSHFCGNCLSMKNILFLTLRIFWNVDGILCYSI